MNKHENHCLSNFGYSCNCGVDGVESSERSKEIQKLYRNVFGTKEGQRVLGNIALRGRVFDIINPNDPVEVSCRNVALDILQLSGGLDSVYTQLAIETKEK